MIIEYWSDYACPFCYIAAARMKRAMREMGIENECRLTFKAFRLNPNAKKVPRRTVLESWAANYGISIEEARARIDRICAMAHLQFETFLEHFADPRRSFHGFLNLFCDKLHDYIHLH